MAGDRVHNAKNASEAAAATHKAAHSNAQRQSSLHRVGLSSTRVLELAEADEVRARTETERARSVFEAARSEVHALRSDESKVRHDAVAAISDAHASTTTAHADIASATADLLRIETRLARQGAQHVAAPSNGTVLQVTARQGGDVVKAGETLAQFVPDTNEQAVELWIDGNDVNLVRAGAAVRLQFEGRPAIQVSGWPSASIGTYGGTVAFVDAHDDGAGRFRVVVLPAEDSRQWPARADLRQGTRATGWVLLREVRLGYEVWRQFNGFPPEWTGSTT
jgi:multidrug resistance efflux pump